ncbi:MAG: hypothetical protein ABJA98_21105 [Acidobacteriota bacterium]
MSNRVVLQWLLPFFVSGGMASGALMGLAIVSDAAFRDGTAGDLAGALGALMVVMCLLVGFLAAVLTSIVRHVLKRPPPGRILWRLALSIAGGILIGAAGSGSVLRSSALMWIPLLSVPTLACWSWRRAERSV